MTTDHGRAFVVARLGDAPDLDALRRVWESLGLEYKKDQVVRDAKDRIKAAMEAR